MRRREPLTYRIERLPEVPAVLSFLVAAGGLDAARGVLDLQHGRGLRPLLRAGRRRRAVVAIADGLGLDALRRRARRGGAERQVVLEPVGVRFDGRASSSCRRSSAGADTQAQL